MPKPNPLSQGLELNRRPVEAPPARTAARNAALKTKTAPSRDGRVLIGGFFSPEVQTALKVLAAQERTTLQALLTEGINTVFAQRGQPEIAGLPTHAEKSEA